MVQAIQKFGLQRFGPLETELKGGHFVNHRKTEQAPIVQISNMFNTPALSLPLIFIHLRQFKAGFQMLWPFVNQTGIQKIVKII